MSSDEFANMTDNIAPFPNTNLQALWQELSLQITYENMVIVIADMVFRGLRQADLRSILQAYCGEIGMDSMYVRDASRPRIFLGPRCWWEQQKILHVAGQIPILMQQDMVDTPGSTSFDLPSPVFSAKSVKTTSDKVEKVDQKDKIPRPPNAFIIFRKYHHPNILKKNPGMHNNVISQIIGKMWQNESVQVRAEFKAKAEMAKREHLQKYPGYQYQPRRPSEKKRRMTKKKAAALAAQPTASFKLAKKSSIIPQEVGTLTGDAFLDDPAEYNTATQAALNGPQAFFNIMGGNQDQSPVESHSLQTASLPLSRASLSAIADHSNLTAYNHLHPQLALDLTPSAASHTFNTADSQLLSAVDLSAFSSDSFQNMMDQQNLADMEEILASEPLNENWYLENPEAQDYSYGYDYLLPHY